MRIRVEYEVNSELRFLSNLDMMNVIQRALRRADIPYALSEGFNPHIRLSMGTVLPVGLWGQREYFDLELSERMSIEGFSSKMNAVLPPTIEINHACEIEQLTPALMKVINATAYVFVINADDVDVSAWRDQVLNRDILMVKSRGKKKGIDKDLKKGIYKIELINNEMVTNIIIWVSSGEPVNIRYDELLDMMQQTGLDSRLIIDVYRQGNYIKVGEQFYSPLKKVKVFE
ncbi:MAG: TIGR03936 family radical SAM-associated protein [Syntrophomonadaceae bacterium]|nr:TIGR03936 family radical SAM-associated protein [Syntrophomonadaceae bacterium]